MEKYNEDHLRPEMGTLVGIILCAVFVLGYITGTVVTALLL